MKRVDRRSRDSVPRSQPRGLSRLVIHASIAASVVMGATLVVGFFYGTYVGFGGTIAGDSPQRTASSAMPTQPSGTAQKQVVHLVALGDSLAHGLGDASGQGFVGDISSDYRQQGDTVIQSNLGIDGLTSGGLLKELKQPSVQTLLPTATVILLSIGGNDLDNAAGLPAIHIRQIASARSQFQSHLTSILKQVRTLNPHAPILLVGLYNPYGNVVQTRAQTDAIVQSWDTAENQIAVTFPNTVVVQTFDLFELHPSQFLYVDHFHPNQQGYQRIAARIWQDLQTTAGAANA